MSLAKRLRKLREDKDMSLDDVAGEAKISKTYLWELERDKAGTKKPSAAVLLRIANALSTSLADLLALPTVQVEDQEVELPPSLRDFQKRMKAQNTPLSDVDLRDLARMKFRGGQPQSVDEWNQLYFVLVKAVDRKKS
jgi:transcriptional regulator with XRE-family HTH domain